MNGEAGMQSGEDANSMTHERTKLKSWPSIGEPYDSVITIWMC